MVNLYEAGKCDNLHQTGQLICFFITVSRGAVLLLFDPFHRETRKLTGKMADNDFTEKQHTGNL